MDGPKRRPPSIVRKELKAAEREVESATVERERIHAELAAAAGRGDHVALRDLSAALDSLDARLAGAEARWFALAEEAEG